VFASFPKSRLVALASSSHETSCDCHVNPDGSSKPLKVLEQVVLRSLCGDCNVSGGDEPAMLLALAVKRRSKSFAGTSRGSICRRCAGQRVDPAVDREISSSGYV